MELYGKVLFKIINNQVAKKLTKQLQNNEQYVKMALLKSKHPCDVFGILRKTEGGGNSGESLQRVPKVQNQLV